MRRAAGTSLVGLLAIALFVAGASAAPASTPGVLDVGDSLSVGTAPYLEARLGGYRIERVHDVGLHATEAAGVVRARGPALPREPDTAA